MLRRRERIISLLVAAGLPLSIMLLLLMSHTPRAAAPEPNDLTMFDVTTASTVRSSKPLAEVLPQPEPVPVAPLPLPAVSTLSPDVVSLLAQAATQGSACDLTAPVQASLRGDPQVMNTIGLLPRDARSVANAVMVWNHDWVSPDQLDPIVLSSLRSTIVASVEAATPECREASQSGPRFLSLGNDDATVVVLGSGQWRWQDLVETAHPSTMVSSAGGMAATQPPVVTPENFQFF